MFLGTTVSDHSPFFRSGHFIKPFVHLLVLAAVINFNVCKQWDPANIYLFKTNSRNTRKRCKKVRNILEVNNKYSRTSS